MNRLCCTSDGGSVGSKYANCGSIRGSRGRGVGVGVRVGVWVGVRVGVWVGVGTPVSGGSGVLVGVCVAVCVGVGVATSQKALAVMVPLRAGTAGSTSVLSVDTAVREKRARSPWK